MKKLLCVLAALTCSINLAACGSKSEGSSSSVTTTEVTTAEASSDVTTEALSEVTTSKTTTTKTETTTKLTTAAESTTKPEVITSAADGDDSNLDLIETLGLDKITVKKVASQVIITMPSDYLEEDPEDEDEDSFVSMINEHNAQVLGDNGDGTVSIAFSESDYNALMGDTRNEFDKSIQEIIDDEYSTITDIKHNADYSAFEVYVTDQEEFKASYDSFSLVSIIIEAVVYNTLSGNTDIENTFSFRYFDANGIEFFVE